MGTDRTMGQQLLIAEGDCRLSARLQKFFAAHEYSVRSVSGGVECLTALHETVPDVLLLDIELNWGGADGVLAVIDDEDVLSKIPVILLTETDIVSVLLVEWETVKCGDVFQIRASPDQPDKLYQSAHVVDRVPRHSYLVKLLDCVCQASAPPTQPR